MISDNFTENHNGTLTIDVSDTHWMDFNGMGKFYSVNKHRLAVKKLQVY